MAKETILKDLDTGTVLYPHTLASLVRTSDGGNVDEALDAFVATNAQFSIRGRCYDNVGNNLADGQFVRTPLIPLNRRCELRTNARGTADKVPYVAFFDAIGAYISGLFDATNDEKHVTVEQYPQNAVYFALSNHEIFGSAHYDNSPTVEQRQEATVNAIMAAKLALFIDQWNEAWGSYGGYDAGATDGKPFLGNGLRMSYEDALEILMLFPLCKNMLSDREGLFYFNTKIRTLIPIGNGAPGNTVRLTNAFAGCENIEIIRFSGTCYASSYYNAFYRCQKLCEISGILNFTYIADSSKTSGMFTLCGNLETVFIYGLKYSLSLEYCKKLSFDSISYLITNAANTAPIIVTVHPDVYAKLTDADNAQWSAVLDAAIAKDISFAIA